MKYDPLTMPLHDCVVYDDITEYGISIVNNTMYLIKGNKWMRLDALIIKEREEN